MHSRRRNKSVKTEGSRSRSRSRRSPPTRRARSERAVSKGRREPERDAGLQGVKLTVLDGIPVVELTSESPLHENASWLLQTALKATGKADGLFEYFDDPKIYDACWDEMRLAQEEVGLVRVKQPDLRDVIAIGTTGKRSVMLAVVVALLLRTKSPEHLWEELRGAALGDTFVSLIQSGEKRWTGKLSTPARRAGGAGHRGLRTDQPSDDEPDDHRGASSGAWQGRSGGSASSSWKSKSEWKEGWRDSWKDADDDGGDDPLMGVKLRYVLGGIPVVDLESSSPFSESVSWLIQTAFDITSKADSVFEYCMESRVLDACRARLGLSKQEVSAARCTRKDLQHLVAVGTCGKRSTMLAIFVAFAMHAEDHLESMRQHVHEFDAKLGKAFDALIALAAELTGTKLVWRRGPSSRGQAQGQGQSQGVKREEWGSHWQTYGNKSEAALMRKHLGAGSWSSKKSKTSSKQAKPTTDVADLDLELEKYMADD